MFNNLTKTGSDLWDRVPTHYHYFVSANKIKSYKTNACSLILSHMGSFALRKKKII